VIESWLEAVRAQVSGERALETVAAIARFHRIQSSPGYDAAAGWLAGQLEPLARSGVRSEIERVPGDGRTRRLGALMPEGWECTHARATLWDRGGSETLCDHARSKLSLIQRSAPARGRHPLVTLDDGTEPAHYDGLDVHGKVVVTRGAVHRVHRLAVVERGAAGLLFDGRRLLPPVRGPEDDPDSVAYTSFWWSEDEPRGWGFVVSPAAGARLRERLRLGDALELEVEIDSRRFATSIPLLSARLPGTSEREVLIVAHLCHPEPSANDNASGVAAALEAVRALAAIRRAGRARRSPLGIRFLWMPELNGTCAYLGAETNGEGGGRAARTVAALNLDMVGENQAACGSTLLIEHPPCFAGSFAEELLRRVRERAQDWVTSYSGPGHYSLARLGEVPFSGGSDHAVLIDPAIGVPCPMLIQWPDRYYHSSLDTPDKCDPASLALAARIAAAYAGFLGGAKAPERRWLLGITARGARRRLLATADAAEPARALEAERLRGARALASFGRLGVPAVTIAREQRSLERFARREKLDAAPVPAPRAGAALAPRRRLGAPLDYQRHLLPGYGALGREEQEAWRRLEARTPGGGATLDLAWAAVGAGEGTLDEVARRVWLETGHDAAESIAALFELTGRLGLSGPPGEGEA
jgi:hypothetical protein